MEKVGGGEKPKEDANRHRGKAKERKHNRRNVVEKKMWIVVVKQERDKNNILAH